MRFRKKSRWRCANAADDWGCFCAGASAAGEYRRRNIFELYIEEVAEACNRLKGGKLKTEKLKAQLQKIANSRTGGMKTDEALGKTGGGPEGLPHSIIVTPEGIEGEVSAALKSAETSTSEVTAVPGVPQTELLGEVTLIRKQGKGKADAKPVKQGKRVNTAKGKAAQLALFSGEASRGKKPATTIAKSGKGHKARGKK